MKRVLTFFVLFLIAGSVTALGYSLYQSGLLGEPVGQTMAATTSTKEEPVQEPDKDLSWLKEIKGLSDDDAVEENSKLTTSTQPAPEPAMAEVTSTSEGFGELTRATSTRSKNDPGQTNSEVKENESDESTVIEDLGKSDALTSTVYDYAFKALALNVEIRRGAVFLTWTPSTSETFLKYHVVRSANDSNPYLPKSSSLRSFSDVTQTAYTDTTAKSGKTYYYRICMTKDGKPPACGNIVKVGL